MNARKTKTLLLAASGAPALLVMTAPQAFAADVPAATPPATVVRASAVTAQANPVTPELCLALVATSGFNGLLACLFCQSGSYA